MDEEFSEREATELGNSIVIEVDGRSVLQDYPAWEVVNIAPDKSNERLIHVALRRIDDGKNLTLEIAPDEFSAAASNENYSTLSGRNFRISVRLMEFVGTRGLDSFGDGEVVRI